MGMAHEETGRGPAVLGWRLGGEGLADAVESDGEQGDGDAGFEAVADGQAPERGQHIVTKPPGADHRGDDHHVQRQHDDLIDADHQGRARRRDHHFPHELARRASRHATEFNGLLGHQLEGQQGAAHHGRHRIDHGGDHRRHRAEAEQIQHRHQIGEHRHGLHEVEERRDDRLAARAPRSPDADQQTDDHAERHGDDDRGQGHHGAVPLAEDREIEETAAHQQAEPLTPRMIAEHGRQRHDGDP